MKLKPGVTVKSFLDEIVLIQGENLVKFNSTGRYIVEKVIDGLSEPDISLSVSDEFDISFQDASGYVKSFLNTLEMQGIIEP